MICISPLQDSSSVEMALKLDGSSLSGRKIRVNRALTKTKLQTLHQEKISFSFIYTSLHISSVALAAEEALKFFFFMVGLKTKNCSLSSGSNKFSVFFFFNLIKHVVGMTRKCGLHTARQGLNMTVI